MTMLTSPSMAYGHNIVIIPEKSTPCDTISNQRSIQATIVGSWHFLRHITSRLAGIK
ncbi:hypothetical protein BJX65DRAFT_275467 [Aspergillus insuetus]